VNGVGSNSPKIAVRRFPFGDVFTDLAFLQWVDNSLNPIPYDGYSAHQKMIFAPNWNTRGRPWVPVPELVGVAVIIF
jgi:hypothetical protein